MIPAKLGVVRAAPRGVLQREAFEAETMGAWRVVAVVSAPDLAAIARFGGFAAADRARAAVEAALLRAAPPGAAVGRLGGDLWGVAARIQSAAGAEALLEAQRAAEPDGVALRIGGAWSAAAPRPGGLLGPALEAHDDAQGAGAELIRADAGGPALRAEIAREAIEAIRAGAASAAFQPVVDSRAPGRVMFSEALIRLVRPDGGETPAGAFMPALARFGLAPEADIAMLRLGFAALVADPSLRLSVNLSARSLGAPAWREAFEAETARAPLAAERLIIEISEDTVEEDLPDLLGAAALTRAAGAALALDDFGAGRTSFRRLRDLRFDIVKIDGAFVRGVESHPDNRVLIAALTEIARRFDMMVVAEHVETAAEARTLADIGVDGFQGFLFGAPALVCSGGARIAPAG